MSGEISQSYLLLRLMPKLNLMRPKNLRIILVLTIKLLLTTKKVKKIKIIKKKIIISLNKKIRARQINLIHTKRRKLQNR